MNILEVLGFATEQVRKIINAVYVGHHQDDASAYEIKQAFVQLVGTKQHDEQKLHQLLYSRTVVYDIHPGIVFLDTQIIQPVKQETRIEAVKLRIGKMKHQKTGTLVCNVGKKVEDLRGKRPEKPLIHVCVPIKEMKHKSGYPEQKSILQYHSVLFILPKPP